MAGFYDTRYKYLFKHPLMVERLMTSFVHESFVRHLDFSSMERLDKSFVTQDFQEKESDIIWKLRYQNKPFYIFLLMEFQSNLDYAMPLRFFRYIAEFYQALSINPRIERYPAVFPLLLYNGKAQWAVPSALQDLIEHSIHKRYIPHFEYYPVIINEIPEATLLKIHNAVSAIFFTEQNRVEELLHHIDRLVFLLSEELPELKAVFNNWFISFIENKTDMGDDIIREKTGSLRENKDMFAETIEEFREMILAQGVEKGLEKGLEEGAQKNRLDNAAKMKELNVPLDIIIKVTGLSADEINKL